MPTLIVKDENISGNILNELALDFEAEYITVKELITSRVEKEVQRQEDQKASLKKHLVLPTDIESRLNRKNAKPIDIEKQVYIAFEAFQNNGFFILIDNEQAEELYQKFHIDDTTNVSFIKLTPLVGG